MVKETVYSRGDSAGDILILSTAMSNMRNQQEIDKLKEKLKDLLSKPCGICHKKRVVVGKCSKCKKNLCEECAYKCPTCGKINCKNHSVECKLCKKRFCKEHLSKCPLCKDYFCEDCIKKEHKTYLDESDEFRGIIIGNAEVTCEVCGKKLFLKDAIKDEGIMLHDYFHLKCWKKAQKKK